MNFGNKIAKEILIVQLFTQPILIMKNLFMINTLKEYTHRSKNYRHHKNIFLKE